MPNCLSISKKLQAEVERLLFLETWRWDDSEDAKLLLSSEKSIEREGETESSELQDIHTN